ncbi:MAG: phosphoribosyltransferase [Candidatus Omnitrophica bacterium]|nr:phosphoribosyltransferase [Candidatus Omnitrophota bacterium]
MKKISFIEISHRIYDSELPEFDCVIGIASGGIIPAAAIAFRTYTDFHIIYVQYRDDPRKPKHDQPRILQPFHIDKNYHSLLIVDDFSISGQTLATAKKLFPDQMIHTLVLQGKADFVLFPELTQHVLWPWSLQSKTLNYDNVNTSLT